MRFKLSILWGIFLQSDVCALSVRIRKCNVQPIEMQANGIYVDNDGVLFNNGFMVR